MSALKLKGTLEIVEREEIVRSLRMFAHFKDQSVRAAERLGINRATLFRRRKDLQIESYEIVFPMIVSPIHLKAA